MKKKVVAALIATMMFGSTLTVDAAGLKDVFNAKYYADQYQDLKDAFGYDEDALYQHFFKYGLSEGRVMNPIIDVVKYREEYGDLDTAFGDDWDAYVNHFFKFGIEEDRDNGTDFDIKAYVEAYGDIKEAFGDDYQAIAEHYMENGVKENRVEASKTVIAQREEAKKQEAAKPLPSPDEERVNGIYTDYFDDGSWVTYEYVNGNIMKSEIYATDGTVLAKEEYTYWENGKLKKLVNTQADGSYSVDEYNETGVRIAGANYNAAGVCTGKHEYDEKGNSIKSTYYDENGEVRLTSEYSYNAAGEPEYWWSYYADGTKSITYVNADWLITKEITYNVDGSYKVRLFDVDATSSVISRATLYRSDDTIAEDTIYENGKYKAMSYYGEGGVLERTYDYDENGSGPIKGTFYKADGSVDYYFTNERNASGQTVVQNYYWSDGTKTIRYYNEAGENYKADGYSADGFLKSETYYKNNCVEKAINYNEDGTYSVSEWDLETQKMKKMTYYSSDGVVTAFSDYEAGKIVKHTNILPEGGYTEVEYDPVTGNQTSFRAYDAAGNLTSETIF